MAEPREANHPLASFDREIEAHMRARNTPGGAVAIVRGNRLVYARGYGLADVKRNIAAGPETLFRLASISKSITGVAVMRLVSRGKLSLDDRMVDRLKLDPFPGKSIDSRMEQITVRQLLQHTAGWDREKDFDPMFRHREIAEETKSKPPVPVETIIRYMLGRKLDFDPGTRYAYSNFGYAVVGRIVERVSGVTYEEFVKREVLAPAGITRMRIGASLYYQADDGVTHSLWGDEEVAWPDGGFYLEAMDAHGGWIGSAVDLARFAAALHDPKSSPIMDPSGYLPLFQAPPPPVSRNASGELEPTWYGLGWSVRAVSPTPPRGDGTDVTNQWHTGSLPGTSTLFVRLRHGLSWAVLFNHRSADKKLPDSDIDAAMHRAAAAVKEWPSEDLFPRFR